MVATVASFGTLASGGGSVDAPSGVQADDLVIIVAIGGFGLTSPAGFAVESVASETSYYHYTWWKRSTGSEPGSYSLTTDPGTAQAFRISGADTSGSPFRQAADTAGSVFPPSTATPDVSLASVPAGDLIFWSAASDSVAAMSNPPSGYTFVGTTSGSRFGVAVKAQSASGPTGAVSSSWDAAQTNRSATIRSIKPSLVSATIAATAPSATASVTANTDTTVETTIGATAPAATASITTDVEVNLIVATAPAATASVTVSNVQGGIGATAPAATAAIDIDLNVPTQIGATAPAATAGLTGGIESTGTIGATAPAATAGITASPAIPPTWQEIVRSVEYLTAAQAPQRTLSARVDMIDTSGVVAATLPVIGGNVSCDSTAAERWAATVGLGSTDLMPDQIDDLLHPLSGLRARIYSILDLPSGLKAEIPLGTYYSSAPKASRSQAGSALTVKLLDVISRVRRNKWGGGQVIDLGGMTVSAALETVLADRAPSVPRSIVATDAVLPDIYEVGEPGRDPWSDVKAIAKAGAYTVYSDRLGGIVAEPRLIPASARTVLEMIVGPDCRMESINRGLDESQLLNSVTVRSSSSEVTPPVYATVEDNDPASPLWVGLGFVYADVIDSDAVTTEAACRELATAILSERRALLESVDIVHRIRPEVDPLELIAIGDPATGANGTYQIASWSIDLAPGSLQRTVATTRRIPV